MLVSSSDDEGSPATTGTGGWKLVGGRTQGEQTGAGAGVGGRRVARRRTMNERDKVRGGVVGAFQFPFPSFFLSRVGVERVG